jgi:kynureninase
MEFQYTLEFARQMDIKDPLATYRNRFFFPQHHDKPFLYFTGNSLGLQPKGLKEAVLQELVDWQNLGVEGHLYAQNPWFSYHERFTEGAARLVGAKENEVVVMNQLTVNLNLLLISFYRPIGRRKKILFETKPFPSDQYAFESHARLHGYEPDDVLVEMQPRDGEVTLRTTDIIQKIDELGEELALVCFGGVNYFTGQLFDMQAISKQGHKVGAYVGFDLAHAAGNVPLKLHEWEADFACWCTYKYLNSGPGSVGGVFIHEKHVTNPDLPKLAGWWGHNKKTRFRMDQIFDPIPTAESWQMSNAPILSMAAHKVALDMFSEVGMDSLRNKSLSLTAYLEFVLGEVAKNSAQSLEILTPKDPAHRGCQLSVVVQGKDRNLVKHLFDHGVIVDWREPNVIRMAPVPLYNSFEDVFSFGQILTELFSK